MNISILTSVLAIFIASNCFSQSANEVSVNYGFVNSALLRNADLVGNSSYIIKNYNDFGVKYLREISTNFSIESGINFYNAQVETSPSDNIGGNLNSFQEDLKVISIPAYVNYGFGKYFSVNGGLLFDIQTTENSFDSQNGIGYGLGVTGKYYFNNIVVFIQPNYKRHALIPFDKEKYHQKLTQFGITTGVGYTF